MSAPLPFHICITIMDDPLYKQSCIRVANALGKAGYKVTLIGRKLSETPAQVRDSPASVPAQDGDERSGLQNNLQQFEYQPGAFHRVRFKTVFKNGKLFYAEMNLRIFIYLLFHKADLVCSVNLDTIVPGYIISRLKGIPRIYDARELFTELAEIVARPRIQKVWLWVERTLVPRFPQGYAVCASIAAELQRRYGVQYAVVRNMTVLQPDPPTGVQPAHPAEPPTTGVQPAHPAEPPTTGVQPVPSAAAALPPVETTPPFPGKYLLYQGAVNYGRGLDELVEAMTRIDLPLVICGTGNYMKQCQALVRTKGLVDRIHFTGQLQPSELSRYTQHAFIGINLVAAEGFNQYYSLPNKLFDYIHAGLPQVTMDYPEYQRVQAQYSIGVLIPTVNPDLIVSAVDQLHTDPELYANLKANCLKAKKVFNWQQEEPVLLEVFRKALHP